MKPIVLMTDSKPYKDERVEIIHLPFIKIAPLAVQTIRPQYDWLIFTSKNAVDIFFDQYNTTQFSKIAAIGIKTSNYLEQLGLKVDFVPTQFNQECFIEEMGDRFNQCTVCLPVSRKARPKLYNALKKDSTVDRIDIYEPVPNDENINKAKALILNQQIDWITFLSPSSVTAFGNEIFTNRVSVIAIGHVTSKALKDNEIHHYVSEQETKQSIIDTIIKIETERKGE